MTRGKDVHHDNDLEKQTLSSTYLNEVLNNLQ
jgi:hypothetical protein